MSRFSWKVTRIIPMLLMMGIIFFLSSVPGEDLVLPDIVNIDKLAHLAIYGLLAFSVFHAFQGARFNQMHPRLVPLLVILFCSAFGLSDEFHQSFVPNRSADVFDVLADSIGAVAVCIIRFVVTHLRKKRSSSCEETSGCL